MHLSRAPTVAIFFCAAALAVLPGCAGEGASSATTGSTTTTTTLAGQSTLASLQQDIFTPICARSGCHDPITRAGTMELSSTAVSQANLIGVASTCAGKLRVAAGKPLESYILDKLDAGEVPCGALMPLGLPSLSAEEINRIRSWIAAGAPPASVLGAGASSTTTVSTTTSSTVTSTTTSTSVTSSTMAPHRAGTGAPAAGKGSQKNNSPQFAPGFASDSAATIERIRRRSLGYVEEFAIEERPKMA